MPEPRDLLPLPPWEGPPIPIGVADIFRPRIPQRLRVQREGIRKIEEVIDLYLRHTDILTDEQVAHVDELVRLRDVMVKRLAEMRRFGR